MTLLPHASFSFWDHDSSQNKLWYSVGPNCVIDMLVELTTLSDACISKMKENKQMELTLDDEINFIHAKTCHICNKKFTNKKNYKVRDHNHIDGKYRGAAHRKCNLEY